ncbi:MAG: hypothetical protein ABFD76_07170 [Smithella sp.]
MKHLWKQRIRKEFDAPAREVIESFAKDNYSKRLTAGAIGITAQTLLNYCRKEGIAFASRKDLRNECKPKPSKKGNINNPWGRRGKPQCH